MLGHVPVAPVIDEDAEVGYWRARAGQAEAAAAQLRQENSELNARVLCHNTVQGLTCCFTLGARADPSCLLAHDPGVRLAGAPGAQ